MPNVEDWVWRLAVEVTGSDKIEKLGQELEDLYAKSDRTLAQVKQKHEDNMSESGKKNFDELVHGVQEFDGTLDKIKATIQEAGDAGNKAVESISGGLDDLSAKLAKSMAEIPEALVHTSVGDTINGWSVSASALGKELEHSLAEIMQMGSLVKETPLFASQRKEAESLQGILENLHTRLDAVLAAHYGTGESKIAQETKNISIYRQEVAILESALEEIERVTQNSEDQTAFLAKLEDRLGTLRIDLEEATGAAQRLQADLDFEKAQANPNNQRIDVLTSQLELAHSRVVTLQGSIRSLEMMELDIPFDERASMAIKSFRSEIDKANRRIQGADNRMRQFLEHTGDPAVNERIRNYQSQINQTEVRLRELSEEMEKAKESGDMTNQKEILAMMNQALEEANSKYAELIDEIEKANTSSAELAESNAGGHLGLEASTNNAQRLADELNVANNVAEQIAEHLQSIAMPEENLSKASVRIQRRLLAVEAQIKKIELTNVPTQKFKNLDEAIKDDERSLNRMLEDLAIMNAKGVDASSSSFIGLNEKIKTTRDRLENNRRTLAEMVKTGEAFTTNVGTDKYVALTEKRITLERDLTASIAEEEDKRAQAAEKARAREVAAAEKAAAKIAAAEEKKAEAARRLAEKQAALEAKRAAEAEKRAQSMADMQNLSTSLSSAITQATSSLSNISGITGFKKVSTETLEVSDAMKLMAQSTERGVHAIANVKLPEGKLKKSAQGILDKLAKVDAEIEKLNRQKVATPVYQETVDSIVTLTDQLKGYEEEMRKMENRGDVDSSSRAFKDLKFKIDETRKSLAELIALKAQLESSGKAFTFGNQTDKFTKLHAERIELEKKLADSVETGVKTGTQKSSGLIKDLGKVFWSSMKGGWKGFSTTAKKTFKGIAGLIKGITKGIKDWVHHQKSLSDSAKQMYKTFTGYLRMLRTRIRRKLVAMVFEDLQNNIKRLAQMSPRLNKAISGFVVSTKTLGAQIVAAFEPLATVLLPLLSQFVDYLTYGAQQVAQFVSKLTGNSTYIKATKGQYDFAASVDETTSSTKKATKAAKEYENTVLGFDQLNKLNGSNDSSEENDLGLDAVDLKNMEDEANAFNRIAEKIHKALTQHDYKGAGKAVAEGINEAFGLAKEKLGWEKNWLNIIHFMQHIIDFVNGFADELDGESIGKAIGDIINSGIMALYMITDPKNGIHFDVLGQRIGEALVAMFKEIKWNEAGKAFMGLIQGFLRGITGMLNAGQGLGKEFGDSLSAFIGGAIEAIRPEDWSGFIASLTNNLFGFLQRAFGDKDRAYELGTKIGGIINDALKDIDADTIAGGINAVATALVEAFNGLWDSGAIGNILQKLGEVWKKIDKKTLIKAVAIALIPAMIGGVIGAIGGLIKALPKFGFKLIGKLFKGIGKLFKLGKKASGSTSGVVSFIDGLKSIGLKFLNATAFLAVVAEIGLVIREYAWVVQSIADIDIGENFNEKLKAVLVLAGTTTLVAAIITALTTGVSQSGIGAGGLLVGELLAGGFIAELWALSKVLDEYVAVVSHICELNITEDYNTKLDKVLQLAVGSAVLVGIITAIGSVASGTVYGGLAMAAGELLAGGILLELYAMNEIIDGFVSTVQDIASLQINEAQYVTNIQAIEAAVLAFTNLMLSTGWTALFQLPGQMATALDLTLIDAAVQTVKEITAIELPDPGKIEEFGNTAQELFNMFSDDSGFLEGLWNGLKGITSNWGNSVDYEGIREKFDIMLYMINGLAGLAQSGVTSEGLQGSWATAMSAVEQQTVTSMNNIVMVISNTLIKLQNLFNNTHLALSFGVAGYTNTQSINHYANGGIIGDGQLFFANEGRPELIGRENDSTVVVNNDQIISSVITGVRQGVIDAMSRYQDTNGNDGGDIVIRIDSEDIAKASLRGQRKINKRQNPLVSFA